MTRDIDYSALLEPITKQEVLDFKATSQAAGLTWGRGDATEGTIFGCAGVVFATFPVLWAGSAFLSAASGLSRNGFSWAGLAALLGPVFAVAAIVGGFILLFRYIHRVRNWDRWMRLSRFAAANSLIFSADSPNPQYPGAIFQHGRSRHAVDHFRTTSGRFIDFGTYEFTTGGKNSRVNRWGFMALHLDRRLPHMLLDSVANNRWLEPIFAPFTREQVLSLEGDFDQHFTLYCPKEYERDALYVFTPDLMALLIDEAAPFDVEIVDDWMFVYSPAPFALSHPVVMERLFRIVDTVGTKTLTQTDRYVDYRADPLAENTVAAGGRRLTTRFPVILIAFVVLCAVVALVAQGALLTGILN